MMSLLRVLFLTALFYAVLASDVIELGDNNFEDVVKEHDAILVEFYAPWCGHCKRLAPEYENAATILNANDPPVPLAKVDCTEPGKDTCSKYSVSGYPTLKIFKNGEFFQDYDGPRDASGIVKYMKTKVGPASIKIDSVEALEKKLASNQPILVGFLSDSGKLETFKKAADKVREDVVCVHTSSDAVMKKYGHTDVVVLYRSKVMKNKFEESEIKFEGEITGSELKKFVNDNALGLCGHRTMENTGKFSSSKPLVVAYYDVDYEKNPKGTNYWRNRIMKVAKNYKDKFVFAISNVQNFNYEMEELGLKGKPKTVQVGIRDPSNKKFPMSDEFSMDKFEEFLKSYLAGDLKAYIKSEQVPENNDGPVKVAVAQNFDEVVTKNDKDILIEFYAPWCGHCKRLAPILEELGEKLKDEAVEIVKMDATANDVPSGFDVGGFPTLYWLPKNSKDSPRRYEGGREVDDFVGYIAKESTDELKGWDRKGKEKKTEL